MWSFTTGTANIAMATLLPSPSPRLDKFCLRKHTTATRNNNMAAAQDFDLESVLLLEHDAGCITDEELLLLLEEAKKKNPEFPYWNYDKFDLNTWNKDECWADFRFSHEDLQRLKTALALPDRMVAYNRITFSGMEGLCLMPVSYTHLTLPTILLV